MNKNGARVWFKNLVDQIFDAYDYSNFWLSQKVDQIAARFGTRESKKMSVFCLVAGIILFGISTIAYIANFPALCNNSPAKWWYFWVLFVMPMLGTLAWLGSIIFDCAITSRARR